MNDLVKRLEELKSSIAGLRAFELWLDDNHPWRIMATVGPSSHKAVAEQHQENAHGDGEWKDGAAICAIVNNVIKLKDDLDTIIAALQPAGDMVMGWQPIETAPKDGTIILIARGKADATFPFVEAAYWSQCSGATGGDKQYPWVTLDETNGVNGRADGSPTHWMPLPSPPAASQKEDGDAR